MRTIAEKHAGGDLTFADFETRCGSKAAEELLERVCDEQCSPGTGQGIIFHDVVAHDPVNHTITGCIEHEDVWYHFVIRNGNWDGTQVEQFELDDPDITVRPPELEVPERLATCLRAYMEAQPCARQAGYACMSMLRGRHKTGTVAAATVQTHALLRGLLGDLAYRLQDYALDALRVGSAVMVGPHRAEELFAELSPELQQALERACAEDPSLGMPVDFLSRGLEPVYRYRLL